MTASAHEQPGLSKSGLLLSPCVYWAKKTSRWYDEQFTENGKREKGTEFHRCIHSYSECEPYTTSDQDVLSWLPAAQEFLIKEIRPRLSSVWYERCVSVNWSTGEARVWPLVKDRKYPQETGHQFGTADIVGFTSDGFLYVADWKTGGTSGAAEQLASLAYAFCSAYDDTPLKGAIAVCLSVSEHGVFPTERVLSWDDLDRHADAMRFQWESIAGSEPVPGIHCTEMYCPHLAFCKAIGDVVADAANTNTGKLHLPVFRMTDSPSSDEEAGMVMERVSAARRQLKYYDTAMREYIGRGGRVVSGTMEWRETNSGFRWVKR